MNQRGKKPSNLLRTILDSVNNQPDPRSEMDNAARYYDGYQQTDDIREYRREHEMPDITINLTQEAINGVLGHEEKSRVDWLVRADDDESVDVAEALNQKMQELTRMVDANLYCSEAFKGMCVPGLSWLYFTKNDDPFDYKYKLEEVHRNQMLYDMSSKRPDMKDCNWVLRRKYVTHDEAMALYPEHKKFIAHTETRWDEWEILAGEMMGGEYAYDYDYELVSNQYRDHLYLDNGRPHIAAYDIYYRDYERVKVITNPEDGMAYRYYEDHPEHMQMKAAGWPISESTVGTIRNANFLGPILLEDNLSPHPHNLLPYIKFGGYRDDETNVHYGLVRNMIGPQDAYNNAVVREAHILGQKRIIKEHGATDSGKNPLTDEEIVHEVHRRDGVINVQPGKRFDVEQDWAELQSIQGIMERSREEIRMVSGISLSFTGEAENQKSGAAIASLAEQSHSTLAELTANYSYGRQILGRIMLAHIMDEIQDQETMIEIPKSLGQTRKKITINGIDPATGQQNNLLHQARVQMALDDIQSSDGYREHVYMRMMEMFQSLESPELQEVMLPAIVEQSEFPKRREIVEALNKKLGRGNSEEEEQQIAEQQAQAAQEQAELLKRQADAEIAKTEADARKTEMEAAQIAKEIEMIGMGDAGDAAKSAEQAARESQQQADQERKEVQEREQMRQQLRKQHAERALAGV